MAPRSVCRPRRTRRHRLNRPYSNRYHLGAADLLDHELPLVSLVEFLGIDTAYGTDIDLHTQPSIVGTLQGIITLGLDEYDSGTSGSG